MKNALKLLSFNTFIPFFYPALMLMIRPWRKKAIEMMSFKTGDKVLIPGVGTGHDLSFIPDFVKAEGVDISDVMLGIGNLKKKVFYSSKTAELKKMDAEQLGYPNNTFDKAILSLFLTVVHDPQKAFAEVVRVLKPGSEILVYDHLYHEGDIPGPIAKSVDAVMKYNFASLTRLIEDCIKDQPVTIEKEIPGGVFVLGVMKGYLLKVNK